MVKESGFDFWPVFHDRWPERVEQQAQRQRPGEAHGFSPQPGIRHGPGIGKGCCPPWADEDQVDNMGIDTKLWHAKRSCE